MLYKRLIINGKGYLLAVSQAGSGAPTATTPGSLGILYMDTDTGDLYKCTGGEDGTWEWKQLSESGSGYTLPIGDTELGGVKNGGNVVINADGTMTAPVSDSSQNVNVVEPAEDDIPKVYFTGTLPTSKAEDDVQLTMHYISKTADFIYPVTLKVQGSSSASYAKKNFTLKPYKDSTYEKKQKLSFKGWPEMNKFVLKAHWIDHSHVRNVGTAKIWGKIVKSRSDYDSLPEELRNAPNNGATDGFTVKVFCNGVYQGLYEWIVPKDKLFGQDSDIATHSILNSEWNNQATCAFATTSPSMGGNWSEELQDSLSSDISTSFANLIKFVAGSTDEEFMANAENYFDVQSVIDFNIFARVFCIVDNLCRNQIFFTYDGVKWYEGCWDVDAVLGLPPTTRGFFAYNTEFQTGYIAYKDHGVTNLLYQRVENLFLDRFKARYAELRSGVLSIENIIDVYERLTDTITTYDGLLAEDYASTTGGGAFTGIPYKTENTIQQLRNFVAQRIPYMDEVIENMTGDSGGTDDGGDTEVTLSSISATYSGGDVPAGTALTELTGIVVTATYSDDNTETVTDYELSGVITEGSNTITVSYGGKTATFTVTGVAEEPDRVMTGISATYSGGDVPVGTSVNSLTGVAVIATYDDGNTAAVSGYVLSGTIAEGKNTVTVTYNGFTTTFTVTGVALPDGVVASFAESTWEEGYWNPSANGAMATALNMHHSQLIPLNVETGESIRIIGVSSTDTNASSALVRVNYFDADSNWIGYDCGSGVDVDKFVLPVQVTQPENAVYYAISANSDDKSTIVITDTETYYAIPDGLRMEGLSWYYGTLNGNTGEPISSTVDIMTDAFDIGDYAGAPFIVKCTGSKKIDGQKIMFFDSDGDFISAKWATSETVVGTIPNGAVTAKISMRTEGTEASIHIGVSESAAVLLGESTVTEILT